MTRHGQSHTAHLQITREVYGYFTNSNGNGFEQTVSLEGKVFQSNMNCLPYGRRESFAFGDYVDPELHHLSVCGLRFYLRPGTIKLNPPLTLPSPTPTLVTLTVNGTTVTKIFTGPGVDPPTITVPPLTPLTIQSLLDKPLPAGWSSIVFRAGDPSLPYQPLCTVAVGAAICGPVSRAGLPDTGGGADSVCAEVKSSPSAADNGVCFVVRFSTTP